MSDIRDWDRDANQNDDPPPDGFPEQMLPGAVNNSAREVMAADRRQWEVGEWFDWGHAITYVSPTAFSVPGDVTSIYQVGRRVWANMPVGGSIYGRVTSASYNINTTVSVAWDSGTLQLESAIQMSIGILSTVNSALPMDWIAGQLGLQTPGILAFEDKEAFMKEVVPIGTIRPWVSATFSASPGTWLECDGSPKDVNIYPELAALLGDTFGDTGNPNTFLVPDLRGRTIFGFDSNNSSGRLTGYKEGINANAIGNSGGEQAHTQALDELVSHEHRQQGRRESGGGDGNENGLIQTAASLENSKDFTKPQGGGQAMNVTPPGLVLNWIIRAL